MSFVMYLLQFVAALDLLAVGLIVPLVSNHVRSMGYGHLYVGALGSVYASFQLGSGPFIGSLSDLKGRKSILMMSLVACSIAYTTMGVTTSISVLLLMRAVLGLFKQTQLLTRALVPDYIDDEGLQSKIYGRMAAISGLGITVGPVIGGHISEYSPDNGFLIIGVIVGLCFAANAGLVYLLPQTKVKPSRKNESRKSSQNALWVISSSIKQSLVELYMVEWSKYWDIFLLKALIGFAMGVYYSNYSLYLQSQYNLSVKNVGYVISFQGIIGSIASFYMGYINSFYNNDEDYSLRNIHVFLLTSLSLIGFILSINIYFYIVWLIPLAIGNATGRLVTLEMILKRCDEDHRGTLIGASNSVRSLSGVAAPMVSGFIGQYLGLQFTTYASLSSTLLGLGLSYYFRSKKVKKD